MTSALLTIYEGDDLEKEVDHREFIDAAICGNVGEIKRLLDKGVDVNIYNNRALKCTVYNGHLAATKFLLSMRADIYATGNIFLDHTVSRNNIPMLKLLIDSKADICARSNIALDVAITRGNRDAASYLLDSKADIRADEGRMLKRFLLSLPLFIHLFPVLYSDKSLLQHPLVPEHMRNSYSSLVVASGTSTSMLVLYYL